MSVPAYDVGRAAGPSVTWPGTANNIFKEDEAEVVVVVWLCQRRSVGDVGRAPVTGTWLTSGTVRPIGRSARLLRLCRSHWDRWCQMKDGARQGLGVHRPRHEEALSTVHLLAS
jgi:hypothetical protein